MLARSKVTGREGYPQADPLLIFADGGGANPFTKEPMQFAAKPASKSVKASPLKVAKDAV
jgi:hypothetical protein